MLSSSALAWSSEARLAASSRSTAPAASRLPEGMDAAPAVQKPLSVGETSVGDGSLAGSQSARAALFLALAGSRLCTAE